METQNIVDIKSYMHKVEKKISDELPEAQRNSTSFSDKLNDMLLDEKQLLVNYQMAINEMIDDHLRDLIIENRNTIQRIHSGLSKELFNRGECLNNVATKAQIKDAFLSIVKLCFLYDNNPNSVKLNCP